MAAKVTTVELLAKDNMQRVVVDYETASRCMTAFPGLYEVSDAAWEWKGGKLIPKKKAEKKATKDAE